MSEKIRDHIIDELRTLSGKKTISQDKAMVVCPFHPDRNPSMGINLDVGATRAPLGWCRCWGCKKSVPWDQYAEAVGLRPIKKRSKKTDDDYLDPNRFKDELIEPEDEDQDVLSKEMKELEFFEFQTDMWRDVPTSVLEKLGCKFCYHDFTGDFYVWMPVMVFGELKGFVKAEIEKPTDDRPSYRNSKGTWSNTTGLLFFDKAVKLMKKKGLHTVVLCEGPRDAIRLLRNGIPAMAVLGALNWGDDKRYLLEQVEGLENLVLFMDGDDAGIMATKGINKNCKTHFTVRYMSLWKYRTPRLRKNGKQDFKRMPDGKKKLLWDNEMDPFTCPKKYLQKVKDSLI